MARKTGIIDESTVTPETPEIDETLLTTAPDDWEFKTVVDESPARVIFEDFGDVFIGQYEGLVHIAPDNGKDDPFDLHTFRGRDGGLYAVNDSYKLKGALDGYVGSWVRLTYVKDIPSGKGNPMKDLKVDVRTV